MPDSQGDTIMIAHDVRRTNDAIDRLLEVTTNPRHRFLLQTFYRHRFLEIAGRYEEIFAPEMMCERPVYHFDYAKMNVTVAGNDVKGLRSEEHTSELQSPKDI